MPELLYADLTLKIRQTAYEVHNYFGPGFLEKVYKTALTHRLRKDGVLVETEKKLIIHDEDGTPLTDYSPDLLVEGRIIIEAKAAVALHPADKAQLINYLKTTGLSVGVLINFGQRSLEFRRVVYDAMRNEGIESPPA